MTGSTIVPPRSWRAHWILATAAAATIATLADAALIQRERSYFTGGFLAADAITGPVDAAGFALASLLADAGVLSLLIAFMLWAAARLGVRQWPATVLATGLALVPVAAADFVSYELASYLGDAFDFRLMWDLAGRSWAEIIAVSWAHLWTVVWVLLGAAVGLLALIWFVRWCRRGSRPWPDRPGVLHAVALPVVLCLVAMTVTTAARRGSDVLDNGIRRKPTGQLLGAVVNAMSDVDGDGYGMLGRPPDADLFDSRVRPYALDVPGDGVDEDAVGGDLSAALPPYAEPAGTAPAFVSKPDVVLIVLESFRADVVGATVDGKPVTPVLDALARRGISARLAYSHNGYTVQARRHIFTGSLADIRGGTTLVDDFKTNGYETAYFSGQDESFGGAENGVGFERADVHFDARSDRDLRYSSFSTAGSLAVPNAVVLKRVTDFLGTRRHDKPLFLYVNFHDTHFPYHHRAIDPIVSNVMLPQDEISPRNASALRTMYLNTAANVDRAIGRVLEEVRSSQGRDPGVVVLSDHGESLFDEGFLGHGYALNEAQTRIPFIVANLPVDVREPLGQGELRDLLWRALTRHDGATSPTLVLDRSRRVFQYLGVLPRAAAIAFTGSDHQLLYDFRDRRVRIDRGSWEPPDALPAARRSEWLELVTIWERMMLSRDKSAVLSRKRAL